MILAFISFLFEGLSCYVLREFVWFAVNMDSISLIIIMINVIILSIILKGYAKTKNEYFILWLAFVARIMIMLLDVYAPDIGINIHSGGDSVAYHNTAVRIVLNGENFAIGNMYANLLSIIYNMFGVQILIGEYFNVLLSMCSIVLIKDILDSLPINQNSRMIGLVIMALGPNYILLSPITLRESVIIFLVTVSLSAFIKGWNNHKFKYVCVAIACSILGAMFHSGTIAMALAYGIIIVLYDRNSKKFTINLKTLLVGMIVIFCFTTISIVIGDSIFGKFQRANEIMDISNEASLAASGGSVYLENQRTGSITEMIINTPIRIVYFLIAPVPWLWRGFNDVVAFIFSTSIYLCAIAYMVKALRLKKCQNKNLVIMFLIMAIVSAIVFAWGVSNSGTALRHREKFLSVYVVMLAVCMNEKTHGKKGRVFT